MVGYRLTLGLMLASALMLVHAQAPGMAQVMQISESPLDKPLSGFHFLTPETRAMQQDDFANPGYLWVAAGAEAFQQNVGAGSCASCHDTKAMVGVATRYPKFDESAQTLINLEGQINQCRTKRQQLPALALESQGMLALSSFITQQSQGMPTSVSIHGPAAPWLERGKAYFFQRRGQLNLACHQCHDESWGKMLRGDQVSQGQPNGFPAYRLEWQSLGSLHRRLQDCESGVRAQTQELGSDAYLALELYLVWRSQGLALESPAVRR